VTIPGASLPLAIIGTFVLWLGFIGENGGRSYGETTLAHIIAASFIAAAAGGVVALAVGWSLRRKPEVELPMGGVLAGLVAISGCGHAVSTPAAFIIGGVAGALTLGVERLLQGAGLDDAVGAVPIHLGGGIWGTLCVGLFGDPHLLGTGLPRALQIKAQIEGLLACGIFGFAMAFGAFKLVGLVTKLRVSGDDEETGLNIAEHGAHTELVDLVDVMEE
jgi:Amt family ammonium transporter